MKLTTRTRYGVRLLFELALHYDQGYIQLNDIAKAEAISEKYLEQIVSFLKSAGFVQSQRGAQGGYVLARSPGSITMNDIVEKLEGTPYVVDCVDGGDCDRTSVCVAKNVWRKLSDAMKSTLSSITLADMVEDAKRKNEEVNYEI